MAGDEGEGEGEIFNMNLLKSIASRQRPRIMFQCPLLAGAVMTVTAFKVDNAAAYGFRICPSGRTSYGTGGVCMTYAQRAARWANAGQAKTCPVTLPVTGQTVYLPCR